MVEPISAALTGIALVQKSVDFIKSNIATANDIKDIAGAIDGLFAGEKQVQQERFGNKGILGQTKDAAHSVIDAKLALEAMRDMQTLVDNRFGYAGHGGDYCGTPKAIVWKKKSALRSKNALHESASKNAEK